MPLWYFWLADDGHARRIATARFHRVLDGKDRIIEFAGRTVDIVEVLIQCEDRHWEGLRLALDSMESGIDRRSRVRDIRPLVSKNRWNREFRFELTDGHYEALRHAIWP